MIENERRRYPRKDRDGKANIFITQEICYEVDVVNYTTVGAKITRSPGLLRGALVRLVIGGKNIMARVIWRNDNFAGLSFTSAVPNIEELFSESALVSAGEIDRK